MENLKFLLEIWERWLHRYIAFVSLPPFVSLSLENGLPASQSGVHSFLSFDIRLRIKESDH